MSKTDKKGLDKEISERISAKYDPKLEEKAMAWIGAIVKSTPPAVLGSDGASLHKWLKDGVILCKLLNEIKPNTVDIRKVALNPKHVLEERQNIDLYLTGCKKLGVPSEDLFILPDLHAGNSIHAVLNNIYALGRQAQVTSSFDGPILGVKYSVSIEEQERRKKKKQEERQRQVEFEKQRDEDQLKRRVELEGEVRNRKIQDIQTNETRALDRKLSKGRITEIQYKQMRAASESKINTLKAKPDQVEVTNSEVKYGLDKEIEDKLKENYPYDVEEQVMDWIELVTGEQIEVFHDDLKSGVILCKLLNCIYPNAIAKFSERDIPLVHRENIGIYVNTCTRLGMTTIFTVNDLYEKQDLKAVLFNLQALSRKAENAPFYKGPILELDGTISRIPKKRAIRSRSNSANPKKGGVTSAASTVAKTSTTKTSMNATAPPELPSLPNAPGQDRETCKCNLL